MRNNVVVTSQKKDVAVFQASCHDKWTACKMIKAHWSEQKCIWIHCTMEFLLRIRFIQKHLVFDMSLTKHLKLTNTLRFEMKKYLGKNWIFFSKKIPPCIGLLNLPNSRKMRKEEGTKKPSKKVHFLLLSSPHFWPGQNEKSVERIEFLRSQARFSSS